MDEMKRRKAMDRTNFEAMLRHFEAGPQPEEAEEGEEEMETKTIKKRGLSWLLNNGEDDRWSRIRGILKELTIQVADAQRALQEIREVIDADKNKD